MESEDGTQFWEMLYDDGTLMQLPASTSALEQQRATAFNFTRGECAVRNRSVKSTVQRFPIHSLLLTLNNGVMLSHDGSNQEEDAYVVCEQEATRTPTSTETGPQSLRYEKQICGITFVAQGGMFTASMGNVPWAPTTARTLQLL